MIGLIPTTEIANLPARERIVETAMRLFYRDGLRATGIDRLIAESGVAKMSFYRHFPSKADLVCAFLEERHKRWFRWFDAAVAEAAKNGGGHLVATTAALESWFGDAEFRGCAFINAATELADPASRERQIAAAHKRDLEARLVALAAADGCAYPAETGRLALIIVEGAIIRAQMTGSSAPARDARRMLAMLVDR
ncbi:MAG: TetR/AcrR family transcriptional regulator [Hyphomicrobiaceae bacterium]|nr:TetR/AcrR family transcriptional regulator [Hyphomicrobiaceae bacterium]